uniref:Uncharacterized protein n=1 Tax=Acrobeloides nanus TaxID=290746 RepID=A0A914BVK3_9BILA
MVMPTCVPRRSIELTQNEDTIQSAYEFWNNLTSQQRQHVEQCLQNYGVSVDIQSNPQYFVTIAKEILLQIPIGQILPQRIQPTSISVNRSNLLNNIQMAMSHQLDPNLHNSERSNLHQQGLITNTNHQQMLRIHGPHVMSQMPNFSQNSMQQFSLQAVYMPVLQQESNMLRQTQINANPDVQAFIDTYGSLQNFPR